MESTLNVGRLTADSVLIIRKLMQGNSSLPILSQYLSFSQYSLIYHWYYGARYETVDAVQSTIISFFVPPLTLVGNLSPADLRAFQTLSKRYTAAMGVIEKYDTLIRDPRMIIRNADEKMLIKFIEFEKRSKALLRELSALSDKALRGDLSDAKAIKAHIKEVLSRLEDYVKHIEEFVNYLEDKRNFVLSRLKKAGLMLGWIYTHATWSFMCLTRALILVNSPIPYVNAPYSLVENIAPKKYDYAVQTIEVYFQRFAHLSIRARYVSLLNSQKQGTLSASEAVQLAFLNIPFREMRLSANGKKLVYATDRLREEKSEFSLTGLSSDYRMPNLMYSSLASITRNRDLLRYQAPTTSVLELGVGLAANLGMRDVFKATERSNLGVKSLQITELTFHGSSIIEIISLILVTIIIYRANQRFRDARGDLITNRLDDLREYDDKSYKVAARFVNELEGNFSLPGVDESSACDEVRELAAILGSPADEAFRKALGNIGKNRDLIRAINDSSDNAFALEVLKRILPKESKRKIKFANCVSK